MSVYETGLAGDRGPLPGEPLMTDTHLTELREERLLRQRWHLVPNERGGWAVATEARPVGVDDCPHLVVAYAGHRMLGEHVVNLHNASLEGSCPDWADVDDAVAADRQRILEDVERRIAAPPSKRQERLIELLDIADVVRGMERWPRRESLIP